MDLELLKRFYLTAQEGSIGKGAEKINIAQSALTRSIHLFEHQLKTKLFERVPSKGVQLTPQGERLFLFAKQILEETDSFERVFHEKEDEVEGEIRILTTPYVGVHWLIPHMTDFLKKYPKVTLKIVLNNDEEIQNLGDTDLGICFSISQQVGVIQELLFPLAVRLFASPAYLEEFGTPEKPEDLDHHRLIVYKEDYYAPHGNWILNIGRRAGAAPRKSYIQADNLEGMVQCALQGMGIIEAPNLSSITRAGLIEIMPEIMGPQVPYYFIFPENRKTSKKINLLFDYLIKKGK